MTHKRNCLRIAEYQQGFGKAIQSRKMVFLITDFITGVNETKRKGRIRKEKELFVSWPIPRGNSSNAAPQGDRIWDTSAGGGTLEPQRRRTFLCDVHIGICKHCHWFAPFCEGGINSPVAWRITKNNQISLDFAKPWPKSSLGGRTLRKTP